MVHFMGLVGWRKVMKVIVVEFVCFDLRGCEKLCEKWFEFPLQEYRAKYKEYLMKSLSERNEIIISHSL